MDMLRHLKIKMEIKLKTINCQDDENDKCQDDEKLLETFKTFCSKSEDLKILN